ncbi:MAG: hypothetical protein AAGE52_04730 [Myxococcota bacterium]
MLRTKRLMVLIIASAGCAVFAGKGDYRDYREVERAEDDRDRQVAMYDYLDRHPDGRWSDDVRAERERQEPGLFEASKSTQGGLQYYLRIYPEGQFAPQARQRLAALESVQGSRRAGENAAREVRQERRTEALEQRRLWGSKAINYWNRILLGVNNWGEPIANVARANEEFNRAFGANPRPRCSTSECIKFYQLDFAIPVPGRTRIDRSLRLLLRLRLEDGKLTRAEMLLPNRGFSRWYELEEQQFIEDADPEQRQHAIDWALQKIIPTIRGIVPTAQGIDVVPEPIDPPTVRAPNQPDPGASAIPGEAPTEEAPAPAPSAPETEEVAAPEETGELVLPLALQGLRTDALRVVVFAAADDDEGPAYDGFFLERLTEEAE